MLSQISPKELAAEVTQHVYDLADQLGHALGVRIPRSRSARIAEQVEKVTLYAQGLGAELSNEDVRDSVNSIIDLLSVCCYPPATAVARRIFDRRAGEAESQIELVLLAARARLHIELGLNVPLRFLATLAGVSVKTARSLASTHQFSTLTKHQGQVCMATEAARLLATRGVDVDVGVRLNHAPRGPRRKKETSSVDPAAGSRF